MRAFLKRHSELILFILPAIFLGGAVHPVLGQLLILVFGVFMLIRRSRMTLGFFYLTILILGDSRTEALSHFKTGRIILLLLLVVLTIRDIRMGRVSFKRSFHWIWPFFLLSVLALVINSPQRFQAFQKTISYFLVVFVAFHFYVPLLQKSTANFRRFLHFTGSVFALGLVLHFLIPGVDLALGIRYQGIFGNPNGIGLFSLVQFPLMVFYYQSRKGRVGRFWFWYLAFLLISLILSGSRNGMLGVLVFLFFGWWFQTRNRRLLFFFVMVPTVYLFFTRVDIPGLIQALGLGEFLRAESIEDGSGRLLSWTFALSKIPEHLWLGGGFSYAEYIYQFEVPEELQIFRQMSSTWNSYLTLLLNNGILGTLAFLVFLFGQVIRSYHKWRTTGYLLALLVAAVYETWLTASLNAFTIYFYIGLGYIGSLSINQRHAHS